jgi:hypothetical protein
VLVQMDRLRQKIGSGIVFVGWEDEGKAQLLAARGVSALGPAAVLFGNDVIDPVRR